MKRVAAVLFHIDLAVNGDQRRRIGIIAVRYHIIDIEFGTALKHCAVSAPQRDRRDAVDDHIAERELLCRRKKSSEQRLFCGEPDLCRTGGLRGEIVRLRVDLSA